jgi:hypothetical protein
MGLKVRPFFRSKVKPWGIKSGARFCVRNIGGIIIVFMKKIIFFVSIFFLPALAYAEDDLGNLGRILVGFNALIHKLIPIAFAIGLLAFFWGLAKYMGGGGSEESKVEGRRIMVGGVIALFVMTSVWGIVAFLAKDLGIDQTKKTIKVPLIGR